MTFSKNFMHQQTKTVNTGLRVKACLYIFTIMFLSPLQAMKGHDITILDARPLYAKNKLKQMDSSTWQFSVNAFDQSFTLELQKNEKLLSRFRKRMRARHIELYSGHIVGVTNSWARISRINGQYTGAVFDGSELLLIDSLSMVSSALPYQAMRDSLRAEATDQVIFRATDIETKASCGLHDEGTNFDYQRLVDELVANMGSQVALQSASQQIEIAIVADTEYVGSSNGDVQGQILSQMNIVDGIFSEQVGVQLTISDIIPLSNNGNLTTTDPFDLLTRFRSFVNSQVGNPGLAHLFSGKNLDGNVIGIAYLNVLCSTYGVGLTQAGGQGTTGALTAAHEFGHNFAAPHDNQSGSACASTQGSFLMSPVLNGSDQFSQCSLDQMAPAIANASCLSEINAPPPNPDTEVIVDNLDANTFRTGTWTVSSGPNPWSGQSVYSNNNGTFRWNPNLTEPGSYDVYAWWTYHANRSTNVPYWISHANGTATKFVNQKDPGLGGQWVLLGTYNFAGNGSGSVEVSSSNGQASADAVRLVRIGDPTSPPPPTPETIVDNLDANTSRTGTWTVSSGPNPWSGQSVYSNNNGTFRWNPNLTEPGSYDVYAWWTYHANRSTNVPYRIAHANGTATKIVNQHDSGLGGRWILLGTYNFDGNGTGYIEVSSENGQASADAVRFVRN